MGFGPPGGERSGLLGEEKHQRGGRSTGIAAPAFVGVSLRQQLEPTPPFGWIPMPPNLGAKDREAGYRSPWWPTCCTIVRQALAQSRHVFAQCFMWSSSGNF